MDLHRLRSLPDGRSTMDVVDVDHRPVPGKPYGDTARSDAGAMFVRHFREDLVSEWHPPSRRQLIVVLTGGVEVETGDGVVRRFGPGELLLAEDMDGIGHRTMSTRGARLYIGLPEGTDLADSWSGGGNDG